MPDPRRIQRVMVLGITACGMALAATRLLSASPLSRSESVASSVVLDIEDELTRRDMELIDKVVRFDAGQREIAAALFDGYVDQINEQSAAHRNLIQSLYQEAQRVADRTTINERIHAENDQWATARIALNNELFESIKALLTQAQLERWPMVERDRRRRTTLNVSPRFYAENVDLIDIADAVQLESDSRDAIDPALNNWADELDGLLQSRTAAQDLWAKTVESPRSAGESPDAQKQKECSDLLNHRSQSIRDLNVRYASLIFTQLPTPGNADFRAAFNLAAYPVIYRATPADHYIDAALKLSELATEQIDAIANIRRDYDEQILAINDQLAVIMRRQEDADPDEAALKRTVFEQAGGVSFDDHGNALIANLNGVGSLTFTRFAQPKDAGKSNRGRGEQVESDLPVIVVPGLDLAEPDSPQGRLEESKRALVERTIASVFDILNPDQQAGLPKPTAEQMLSPEEKVRRVMEKAFSTALITHNADGSVTLEIIVEDDDSPDP